MGDQKLKKLGAFDLAPGKASVDIAVQEPLHLKGLYQFFDFLNAFRSVSDDEVENLQQLDPGDGRRALRSTPRRWLNSFKSSGPTAFSNASRILESITPPSLYGVYCFPLPVIE